ASALGSCCRGWRGGRVDGCPNAKITGLPGIAGRDLESQGRATKSATTMRTTQTANNQSFSNDTIRHVLLQTAVMCNFNFARRYRSSREEEEAQVWEQQRHSSSQDKTRSL
ncbi:unnamed protein product, partial [Ectocarpus sp. 12 AP-2014]